MQHNRKLTKRAQILRRNMTKEERRLWYEYLHDYPYRFRRQVTCGRFILDFYCAAAKLAIELDGSQHYEPNAMIKDTIRTGKIEERNLTVIRIPNNAINENFRGVCEYIDNFVRSTIDPTHQKGPLA